MSEKISKVCRGLHIENLASKIKMSGIQFKSCIKYSEHIKKIELLKERYTY